MSDLSDVFIVPLKPEDAPELSGLLKSSAEEYTRYFIPFSFDEESIRNILTQKIKDRYFGIKAGGRIAGFYMLRGFDQGYDIPSYGVWIAEEFSNKGLSKLTLQHAFSFCAVNNIKKLMLKVAPENVVAKKIYEKSGFKFAKVDEKIGHLVYYKEFQSA